MNKKEKVLRILNTMLEKSDDKSSIQFLIDNINSGEQDISKLSIQADIQLEKFDGEYDVNKKPVEVVNLQKTL